MSKWTPEQIEEERIRQDIKHNVDYECVQFGKWINEHNAAPTNHNEMWFIWGNVKNDNDRRNLTTEELYQLYLNDINNSK
mgnify:CR=1 FL=1